MPRILPAPQAFLKASRPQRMPETNAVVTGVESGIVLESISFFANTLVPMDDLPAYAFKVLEIKHSDRTLSRSSNGAATTSATSTSQAGLLGRLKALFVGDDPARRTADVEMVPGEPNAAAPDIEGSVMTGNLRRRNTLRQQVENTLVSGGRNKRPAIPAKLMSPLHMLTLSSSLISLVILVCAVIWHDGTAILSISLISLASSITSFASWWEPRLMSVEGTDTRKLPPGDIMIRTREGAFLYIRCKEEVTRELFAGTEQCKYRVNGGLYNFLMASGTVILMLAIVLLGNCKWNSQVFIGAAYIVLNGLYWGLGMVPKKYFWDLSRYEVRDVTPHDAMDADKRTKRPGHRRDRSFTKLMNKKISRVGSAFANSKNPPPGDDAAQIPGEPDSRACFSRTLWYAIR
ncbi:hypothetical protein IMZ48_34725, partial [Candidatus Bathyarchaeota archaeon]|nr:hypothetical protein [Candidatus Bathyarchaeota archaeon]